MTEEPKIKDKLFSQFPIMTQSFVREDTPDFESFTELKKFYEDNYKEGCEVYSKRLNEYQILSSHNSYSSAILDIWPKVSFFESLLHEGFRALELDVNVLWNKEIEVAHGGIALTKVKLDAFLKVLDEWSTGLNKQHLPVILYFDITGNIFRRRKTQCTVVVEKIKQILGLDSVTYPMETVNSKSVWRKVSDLCGKFIIIFTGKFDESWLNRPFPILKADGDFLMNVGINKLDDHEEEIKQAISSGKIVRTYKTPGSSIDLDKISHVHMIAMDDYSDKLKSKFEKGSYIDL